MKHNSPRAHLLKPARPWNLLLQVLALMAVSWIFSVAQAQQKPLQFGVGMFQPDREKNDATYRPLAEYLAQQLGRPVVLRTVDSWEGLAKSLSNGETDMALMGPWGYVLANQYAGAQVVSTILYNGKPSYHAIIITHPGSGLETIEDVLGAKGKNISFAFGDKGSTSGYLIPLHFFMQKGIDPQKHFARVLHTKHQAIQMQVTRGQLQAGADYDRNRNAMIAQAMISAPNSVILWESDPLPNDAFAVSAQIHQDTALVAKLTEALRNVANRLPETPNLLPANYTGFVDADNTRYKSIRDAGLATGTLRPRP